MNEFHLPNASRNHHHHNLSLLVVVATTPKTLINRPNNITQHLQETNERICKEELAEDSHPTNKTYVPPVGPCEIQRKVKVELVEDSDPTNKTYVPPVRPCEIQRKVPNLTEHDNSNVDSGPSKLCEIRKAYDLTEDNDPSEDYCPPSKYCKKRDVQKLKKKPRNRTRVPPARPCEVQRKVPNVSEHDNSNVDSGPPKLCEIRKAYDLTEDNDPSEDYCPTSKFCKNRGVQKLKKKPRNRTRVPPARPCEVQRIVPKVTEPDNANIDCGQSKLCEIRKAYELTEDNDPSEDNCPPKKVCKNRDVQKLEKRPRNRTRVPPARPCEVQRIVPNVTEPDNANSDCEPSKLCEMRKAYDVTEDNDPSEDYCPPYRSRDVLEPEHNYYGCGNNNPQETELGNIADEYCIEDFQSMNFRRLLSLSRNKNDVCNYLRYCGIIPEEKFCPRCKGKMSATFQSELWRCYGKIKRKNQKCEKKVAIRQGTWFTRSKLSLGDSLLVTYMVIYNYTCQDIERELDLNKNTVSQWFSSTRQVLTRWAVGISKPIGGQKRTVELKGCKFAKIKFRTESDLKDQWTFGGIERETGLAFMAVVPDKKSTTLAKVITEWVLPMSTVITDSWNADVKLEAEDYRHLTTNHGLTFATSSKDSPSLKMENAWRLVRNHLPHFDRTHQNSPGYLSHCMFFRHCKANNLDPFETFLRETAKINFD